MSNHRVEGEMNGRRGGGSFLSGVAALTIIYNETCYVFPEASYKACLTEQA